MAAAAAVQLDEMWGLPILTVSQLNALSILQERTVITTTKMVVFQGLKITIYNDQFIRPKIKLACQALMGNIDADYAPVELIPSTDLSLPPNYTSLKLVYNACERAGNDHHAKALIPIEARNLPVIISLFSIYPIFGPLYENYLENKDLGVQLLEEARRFDLQMVDGRYTVGSVKATIHLLLLLMTKSFPNTANQSKHVRMFMENRLKAVRFVLKDPNAEFLVTPDTIQHMSALWSMVPKLKTEIFTMCVALRSEPEIRTAVMLLADSSMTTINSIHQFIRAGIVTRAHAYPEIWSEVDSFNSKVLALKQKHGQMWPHYRILDPDDMTLAASRFPNLSKAAIIYMKKFIDTSASFARVVEPKHLTIPGLEDAAATKLDESWLNVDANVPVINQMSEAKQNVNRGWGIDLAKWRTPERMRALLYAGANQADAGRLEELMNLIRGGIQ